MLKRLYSGGPLIQVLTTQASSFPFRDSWHFPYNGVRWTHKEVDTYSLAYAQGLAEIGLESGNKVATWLTCLELPESLTLTLACAKAGLQVCPISDKSDWPSVMQDCSALILSPWQKLGEDYRIDFVLDEIPEMRKTPVGAKLISAKFPKLKWIVQTGFRTIRGSLKMKHIPVYNLPNYIKNPLKTRTVDAEAPLFVSSSASLTHQDFLAFAESLASQCSLKPGDVMVNSLSWNLPITAASAFSSSAHGIKSVIVGKNEGMYLANDQGAKVLLVSPDRAGLMAEPGDIPTLLVAAQTSQEVEQTEKQLKAQGISAKKVLGFNSQELTPL